MLTVEIKARIWNYHDLITKIYGITNFRMYLIKTADKFYKANNGYLMLRKFEEYGYASLISYKRSDEEGLQMCTSYGSLQCHGLGLLEVMLYSSNGLLGTIKKKRRAYYTKEAQINIDSIDKLGNFIEIKVVDMDIEIAKTIVNSLMTKLSITRDDLITSSYIDLMLENQETSSENETSSTLEIFETSDVLETSETFDVLRMSVTSKMLTTSGTPKMFATSETSELQK